MLSRHSTDSMTTLLLADFQGIFFDNLIEEHHILTSLYALALELDDFIWQIDVLILIA